MNYSTELYFDKSSEDKIKEYIDMIHKENIKNTFYDLGALPHISLAVYNDGIDHLDVIKKLETFQPNKLKISFKNIGYFCSKENAIFLSPKINPELLDLHKKYHKEFKKFIKSEWEYYLPENWVPHCTVALDLPDDDFIRAVKVLKDNFEPLDATIERIEFIKFRPIERLYQKFINIQENETTGKIPI